MRGLEPFFKTGTKITPTNRSAEDDLLGHSPIWNKCIANLPPQFYAEFVTAIQSSHVLSQFITTSSFSQHGSGLNHNHYDIATGGGTGNRIHHSLQYSRANTTNNTIHSNTLSMSTLSYSSSNKQHTTAGSHPTVSSHVNIPTHSHLTARPHPYTQTTTAATAATMSTLSTTTAAMPPLLSFLRAWITPFMEALKESVDVESLFPSHLDVTSHADLAFHPSALELFKTHFVSQISISALRQHQTQKNVSGWSSLSSPLTLSGLRLTAVLENQKQQLISQVAEQLLSKTVITSIIAEAWNRRIKVASSRLTSYLSLASFCDVYLSSLPLFSLAKAIYSCKEMFNTFDRTPLSTEEKDTTKGVDSSTFSTSLSPTISHVSLFNASLPVLTLFLESDRDVESTDVTRQLNNLSLEDIRNWPPSTRKAYDDFSIALEETLLELLTTTVHSMLIESEVATLSYFSPYKLALQKHREKNKWRKTSGRQVTESGSEIVVEAELHANNFNLNEVEAENNNNERLKDYQENHDQNHNQNHDLDETEAWIEFEEGRDIARHQRAHIFSSSFSSSSSPSFDTSLSCLVSLYPVIRDFRGYSVEIFDSQSQKNLLNSKNMDTVASLIDTFSFDLELKAETQSEYQRTKTLEMKVDNMNDSIHQSTVISAPLTPLTPTHLVLSSREELQRMLLLPLSMKEENANIANVHFSSSQIPTSLSLCSSLPFIDIRDVVQDAVMALSHFKAQMTTSSVSPSSSFISLAMLGNTTEYRLLRLLLRRALTHDIGERNLLSQSIQREIWFESETKENTIDMDKKKGNKEYDGESYSNGKITSALAGADRDGDRMNEKGQDKGTRKRKRRGKGKGKGSEKDEENNRETGFSRDGFTNDIYNRIRTQNNQHTSDYENRENCENSENSEYRESDERSHDKDHGQFTSSISTSLSTSLSNFIQDSRTASPSMFLSTPPSHLGVPPPPPSLGTQHSFLSHAPPPPPSLPPPPPSLLPSGVPTSFLSFSSSSSQLLPPPPPVSSLLPVLSGLRQTQTQTQTQTQAYRTSVEDRSHFRAFDTATLKSNLSSVEEALAWDKAIRENESDKDREDVKGGMNEKEIVSRYLPRDSSRENSSSQPQSRSRARSRSKSRSRSRSKSTPRSPHSSRLSSYHLSPKRYKANSVSPRHRSRRRSRVRSHSRSPLRSFSRSPLRSPSRLQSHSYSYSRPIARANSPPTQYSPTQSPLVGTKTQLFRKITPSLSRSRSQSPISSYRQRHQRETTLTTRYRSRSRSFSRTRPRSRYRSRSRSRSLSPIRRRSKSRSQSPIRRSRPRCSRPTSRSPLYFRSRRRSRTPSRSPRSLSRRHSRHRSRSSSRSPFHSRRHSRSPSNSPRLRYRKQSRTRSRSRPISNPRLISPLLSPSFDEKAKERKMSRSRERSLTPISRPGDNIVTEYPIRAGARSRFDE